MSSDNTFTLYQDAMSSFPASQCVPWTVVLAAECLAIVTVNILAIIVFVKQRKHQRRGTYLIINLSILDLLVGGVSGPLFIEWNMSVFCDLWGYNFNELGADHVKLALIILFPFSSVTNLTVISLERLSATFRPLKHRVVDKRLYLIAVCVIWLPTALWEGLRIAFSLVLFIGYFSHLSFCLFVICVSYTSIFLRVRHSSPHHVQHQIIAQRERKLTVTLLIVTLVSLLTWLPSAIFFLVVAVDDKIFWGLSYLSHFHMSVAFTALSLCNSLVNPVIYTMRIREFRVAICKLFRGA